jgi:hypothetical protein
MTSPSSARRHMAATLAMTNAVPIEVVSRMLGHSSIRQTSDTYGHLRTRHLEAPAGGRPFQPSRPARRATKYQQAKSFHSETVPLTS